LAVPEEPAPRTEKPLPGSSAGWFHRLSALVVLLALIVAHGWAILSGMGGVSGLTADSPLFRHDHPLYLHSAIVTRSFLKQSWTTAGYDPSFMAGYPKSVVFPASSTLPEVVLALFPNAAPYRVYKFYVFISVAIVPLVVALAGWLLDMRPGAIVTAVGLFLTYLWTDWPINYASLGMVPYLLAVPWCLLTISVIGRFLERGSFGRCGVMILVASAALLIHLTSAMIVVIPAFAAYLLASVRKPGLPKWSHAGFWGVPVAVLAVNVFWWWPGILLSSTKGASNFAFEHSDEGVFQRISKIASEEAPIEIVLIVLGLIGLVVYARRNGTIAMLVGGMMAMGFGWGYLAASSRSFDFLQPGRHTFALYSAACLAAGVAVEAVLRLIGRKSRVLAFVAGTALLGLFLLCFGSSVDGSVRYRTNPRDPFLSSRTPRRLKEIERWIKRSMEPGERLLYEEGGFDIPGLTDPFAGGRYSGLLADRTGVELLGGPYLHVSLKTNFTQFGEYTLFGKENWDRAWFVRYATIYRPSAIICWTPHARRFCLENRDLIDIDHDDGRLLFGKVIGFGGDTVRGKATVRAEPGRLRVRIASSDVDELVILRYHSVPTLSADPPVPIEPVFLADDPVPFIGLRANRPQEVTLELNLSP
jgi:hypothetical protein